MRKTLRASVVIPVVVLVVCASPQAWAQQEEVGRIERIARLVGGGRLQKIKQPTSLVQIRREAGGAWEDAAPKIDLFQNDALRVQSNLDVQLEVRGAKRGRLTFLPELRDEDGRLPLEVVAMQPTDLAVYEMRPDTLVDVDVHVGSGSLVVDWTHGRLVVLAAGTRSVFTGTRAAFWMIDPSGDEGFLFLESGAVSFPQYPQVSVSPGTLVRLRRGLAPEVSVAAIGTASRFQNAIRYNGKTVWSKLTPFWAKPAFFVPAAAAVAGTTAIVVATRGDGQTVEGTVIIRIPLSVIFGSR